MKRVMSVVPALALICACSSQSSLEPATLTYLASVSPVVGNPTTFKITGSIQNNSSNTVILHPGPCGAIGFQAYTSPPPVTGPVFGFNPLAAVCILNIPAAIELRPGEIYPVNTQLSAGRTPPPGVYLATVIFDYNGDFKEVGAGTIEIR
jgi:hypothetical protein